MVTECKCSGVSGSCNIKKCWKKLPLFRDVGNALKKMYKVATKVKPMAANGLKVTHLIKFNTKEDKPRTKRMVYMIDKINYCKRSDNLGVPGTVGRKCTLKNTGEFGCKSMCCKRGYNTHQYNHTSSCECKFFWCCYVTCKVCSEERTVYHCKWQWI